jgi:hypothetical protein
MNPAQRSSFSGIALPLATSALAAWQAVPSLIEAWRTDLYSRGAPLAFFIWLVPLAIVFFKQRAAPGPGWIGLSLLLCAAGSMAGVNLLQHLALATAVAGLSGLRFYGFVTTAASAAWLPASGWFLSHMKSGGFAGWERPVFAVLMALVVVAATSKPSFFTSVSKS